MWRRLRDSLSRIFIATALISSLSALAFFSSMKQSQLSSVQEIQSPNNVSNLLDRNSARTVQKSRNSAVNIMSISEDGYISSSSGTYFTSGERHYVITVGHGIVSDCDSVRILSGRQMSECVDMKIIDRQIDYAIMEVEPIYNREPIRLPRDYPIDREWSSELAIQRTVYYTGYPNGMGPLTFGGEIAGHDTSENIYMHSFAWPGSSGSGVFSESGKLIGIIIAISVGATEYGVDVLEDMVIVIPLYKIDWSML